MLELRKDLDGNTLPIKNHNIEKVCTPEELIFFFKNGFNEKEERFKIILLTQLGCACRIHEACAININDFHENSGFRKLDMLIQKKVKTVTQKDGTLKRIGCNEIITKDIPESIAAYIRNWIQNNLQSIMFHDGYIFPPNPAHSKKYYDPNAVTHWLDHKREQLVKLYPERGFDKVIAWKNYKKPKIVRGHITQQGKCPIHMWTTHLMKRFAGTYGYIWTKDPLFCKELLSHSNFKTTEKHYIDVARAIESNAKIKAINKMFDVKFYDEISNKDKIIPAVWTNLD